MSNRPKLRARPPDADELAFRDELRKGCPGCGSRVVTDRFTRAGKWEYTLRCEPSCPSHTGALDFTGHTIAAAAARRAEMTYRAIDGSSGGVVLGVEAVRS